MEKESINPIEFAHMKLEYSIIREALTKNIPSVGALRSRRMTYLLIETRRAAYGEAGSPQTLKKVLDQFDVGYDAYYDWREKWYLLLPNWVKKWAK